MGRGETTAEDRSQRLRAGIIEAADEYRARFNIDDDCILDVMIADFAMGLIDDREWPGLHCLNLVPVLDIPYDADIVNVLVFRRGTWGAGEL